MNASGRSSNVVIWRKSERNQFLAGVSLACAAARWPSGRARVLGWRQLEQDAKRDGESTAAAEDRARLAKVCLRLC
jgi:hypothetical protein